MCSRIGHFIVHLKNNGNPLKYLKTKKTLDTTFHKTLSSNHPKSLSVMSNLVPYYIQNSDKNRKLMIFLSNKYCVKITNYMPNKIELLTITLNFQATRLDKQNVSQGLLSILL